MIAALNSVAIDSTVKPHPASTSERIGNDVEYGSPSGVGPSMLVDRVSLRRMRDRWLPLTFLLPGALALGCGGQVNGTAEPSADAAPEASTLDDASKATDATVDASIDGLTDGSIDALNDTGSDASLDGPYDADATDADSGPCSAGQSFCNGTCIDPTSDPANCGGCGHACIAGPSPACSTSLCQYTIKALADAWVLATDGTNIYWGSLSGQVGACPLSGCGDAGPTVYTNAPDRVGGIATDGHDVYWTTSQLGTVMRSPVDGSGGPPTTLASGRNSPGAIATDGVNVTWADANTVLYCPVGGCGSGPITLASGQNQDNAIATDGHRVYWPIEAFAGAVLACDVGGCGGTPSTLASPQEYAQGIATDGLNVYWLDYSPGLQACAVGGCANHPSTLAAISPPPATFAIATDGTNVYFTAGANVMSCPVTGCSGSPMTIASPTSTQSIATTVAIPNVYWTDLGSVKFAPK